MNEQSLDAGQAVEEAIFQHFPQIEQSSAVSDQDSQGELESVVTLDLAHLRDLLGLLKDMDVAAFSAGGIQVAFRQPEPDEVRVPYKGRTREQTVKDEDNSTSSQPVSGFSPVPLEYGFKNPNLWPGQGGKMLKFDGSLSP